MIRIRRSKERGHADHGWLDSFHTFSFNTYYDPAHMGFRSLRVINEDRVAPGRGFGAHGHRDMEILSYVLDGSLAHQDSIGHKEVLGPNEIQRMSAGRGVTHSEFNASHEKPVHFLQIWIQPASVGSSPSYEQIRFETEDKKDRWKLLAGPQGGVGASRINQDARVLVTELAKGGEIQYALEPARHAWLQVLRGTILVNGNVLEAGDAIAASDEPNLSITATGADANEVLLFDLA
jgi:redox-sensitive bicupin YhaK (pirin superfamily)